MEFGQNFFTSEEFDQNYYAAHGIGQNCFRKWSEFRLEWNWSECLSVQTLTPQNVIWWFINKVNIINMFIFLFNVSTEARLLNCLDIQDTKCCTQSSISCYHCWLSLPLSLLLFTGLTVRCRGQQHGHCGAIRCMGQTQELGRELLLQPQLCVQWPLGLSEWRSEIEQRRRLGIRGNGFEQISGPGGRKIPECNKTRVFWEQETLSVLCEQYCIRNIPVYIPSAFLKNSSALVSSVRALIGIF